MGKMYAVAFDGTASPAAAFDVFEVTAASTCSVIIHGWDIGQSSDYGDSAAEGLRLALIRGYTTSGNGSANTPTALSDNVAAAASAAEVMATTVASTGTPVTIFATAWNAQAGHVMWFTPECRPRIAPSGRVVLRVTGAPADAVTMSGTLFFEEM